MSMFNLLRALHRHPLATINELEALGLSRPLLRYAAPARRPSVPVQQASVQPRREQPLQTLSQPRQQPRQTSQSRPSEGQPRQTSQSRPSEGQVERSADRQVQARSPVARWFELDPFKDPFFNSSNLFTPGSFGVLDPFFDRTFEKLSREVEHVLPQVQMRADDSAYTLQVELPGVQKEDIKINLGNKQQDYLQVTITAERKEELDEAVPEETEKLQASESSVSTPTTSTVSPSESTESTTPANAVQVSQPATTPSTSTKRTVTFRRYMRTLTLPEDSDVDQLSAKYENGVLSLTVPKLSLEQEPEQRQIPVF